MSESQETSTIDHTLADEIIEHSGCQKYDTNTVPGLINNLFRLTKGTVSMGERNSFFPIKDFSM